MGRLDCTSPRPGRAGACPDDWRVERRNQTAGEALPLECAGTRMKASAASSTLYFLRSPALFFGFAEKSGRLDLNQRPLRPERSALAKLSYAPCCVPATFPTGRSGQGCAEGTPRGAAPRRRPPFGGPGSVAARAGKSTRRRAEKKPGRMRCKPGSVLRRRGPRRRGEGHFSGPDLAAGLCPLGRASGLPAACPCGRPGPGRGPRGPARRCLALHPAGFAVPTASRPSRCALTAPFHPYRAWPCWALRAWRGFARRFVFCGTVPVGGRRSRAGRPTDGGRYPSPWSNGARTFLPPPSPRARAESGLPRIRPRVIIRREGAMRAGKTPADGPWGPTQRFAWGWRECGSQSASRFAHATPCVGLLRGALRWADIGRRPLPGAGSRTSGLA